MHHLPLFPFLPAHRARRRENEAGEGGKAHTSVSGGGRGETEEGRKTDRKRGRRRRRRALKGFVRCFCSHGKGGGGRRRGLRSCKKEEGEKKGRMDGKEVKSHAYIIRPVRERGGETNLLFSIRKVG